MTEADSLPAYLTPTKAAGYLGLSERTLIEYRRRGTGPRYSRLGGSLNGRVRYRRQDLDRWMLAQSRAGTKEELAEQATANGAAPERDAD